MSASEASENLDEGVRVFLSAHFSEGEKIWVKSADKEIVWEAAEVIAKSVGSSVAARTVKGKDVLTSKAFYREDVNVSKRSVGYQDMTAMRFVNEPQILENLRIRSLNEQPYTFLGPVLVAVNPIAEVESLSDAAVPPGKSNIIGTAHPYAVAELAYQQMLFSVRRPEENVETPTDQTVIVSGESGSGKTVSSRLVINHLVARSGTGSGLAQAMLGSNPITESFGNAKTLRNSNSSRFGKMFRVVYDKKGMEIIGATVGTYLLERSRITLHEVGERNFHVFYELLAGAPDALLAQLKLERGKKYRALLPRTENANELNVNFLDYDKRKFEKLTTSLRHVGMSEEKYVDIMKIIAAVLHLSDMVFESLTINGNDASKVNAATRPSLVAAAEMLGVAPKDLEETVTQLERKVGAQVIKSPVSSEHAQQLLDGVTKALYTRLFAFMINNINDTVNKAGNDAALPKIGVLDIFGFESFQRNDLEQLLINYTNEVLALIFNKQVLEAEAALYQREQLAISEQDRAALDPSRVVDESNKFCVDLLQGVVLASETSKKGLSPGILDVIHEQGRIPAPSEKKMIAEMHKTFLQNELYPNYIAHKKTVRNEFSVKHYAGKVTYTTGNFLLKNIDALPKTASDLFLSSTKEITKAVWDAGENAHGVARTKKDSIVSYFKKQITELMDELNATTASFIRCIKPNAEMHHNEGWFNKRYITVQLRNLSVPKTADVLKAGLPTRIPYAQLVDNYKAIFGSDKKVKVPDLNDDRGLKSFIAALFFAFEIPRSAYKLGLTKVFFKSGDLDKLDEVLSSADAWQAKNLDATSVAERDRIIDRYKSYYLGRRWKVILRTLFAAQQFVRLLKSQQKQRALELRSAILLEKTVRMYLQRRKYLEILLAKKLEEERIAREKAEAERRERERLAEEARQRELEKQRQLKKLLDDRREKERKEKLKFAKMYSVFKQANKEAADYRQKDLEMKQKERARRVAEEKAKKAEEEKQRQELEKLRLAREAEEQRLLQAAEDERKARLAYEEKLHREARQRDLEARQRDLEAIERQINQEKLEEIERQMNQEKLEEKIVLDQVVDEVLAREEKEEILLYDSENDEGDAGNNNDNNPWFFYDDVELDEIDNVEEEDEERINEALKFLDNLGEDDDDDDDDDDDEDLDAARRADIANKAGGFQDYNGPFIVNVNMQRLESTQKRRRYNVMRGLQPWKQCFAFIFPQHQRVLLHYGTDQSYKVQFNAKNHPFPATLLNEDTFQKKKNIIHVTGVRLQDVDNNDPLASRELVMSFFDSTKRKQFAKLMESSVTKEKDVVAAQAKTADNVDTVTATAVQVPSVNKERRVEVRAEKSRAMAMLNRAVKTGKLKKEKVHDILRQEDVDDDDDGQMVQIVSCPKCRRAVSADSDKCPHCGAKQN